MGAWGRGCTAAWVYRCTGIWVYPNPKPQTLILSVTLTLNLTLTLIDPVIDVTQARTDGGSTPLLMACQNGHLDVALALLEKAQGTILVNQVKWCHNTCAIPTLPQPGAWWYGCMVVWLHGVGLHGRVGA